MKDCYSRQLDCVVVDAPLSESLLLAMRLLRRAPGSQVWHCEIYDAATKEFRFRLSALQCSPGLILRNLPSLTPSKSLNPSTQLSLAI